MKKKVTVYSDDDHEILNVKTGEMHYSDTDNIVCRKITVEELFDDPESEKENTRFMDDVTYIRNFRYLY